MSNGAHAAAVVAAGIAAAGASTAAWAVFGERRRFQLRQETVQILPAGSRPLRILHISDLHTVPGQETKKRFVRSLAALRPDLVIDTGDNLSHLRALPYLLEILEPLFEFPGVYVPGSNCYFAPQPKNPLRYLWRTTASEDPADTTRLPTEDMHRAFDAAGWTGLINRHDRLRVRDTVLDFSGVDDPHLAYDRHPGFPETRSDDDVATLRIGVAHAPYLRTLDRFVEDGADLIFAGHTHGGQVCLPGGRALVSNCDLDPAICKGLIDHRGVPVNISQGLGESRFAPVRLFCPPQAVLITLTD
ncbi:metallophosphoesterase family protein [Kocuria sp. cx-455]|uniref:metallophosphoesterase n=1 Tax=Kocuria sp. cx-455 TaxID=2771377 RepID=UPI0016858DF5|nr:metallophosphoesterase [Kocuria sp. cx-455]MBD2764144.1 metallophosphoesterase family protein [Kocuria sp. cx-455]